jgi:hypothetical protein
MVQDVIRGRILHPKRTGNPKDSTVIKTTAQSLLSIPTSGTAGWVDGNMISVVQNVLDAHVGTIVFAVDQTTGVRRVLFYVKPNRDLESISSKLSVLYTTQSISAPLMATGANVTVQAQLMLQQGASTINPASIIPGKMSNVVDGGISPIEAIGSEEHTIVRFTATDPETLVERFSSFDPANTSLVRVPNPGSIVASSSAWVSPSQTFTIVSTGVDAASAASCGFTTAVTPSWGSTVDITTSEQVIWSLLQNNDAWVHMLYGDVVLDLDAYTTGLDGIVAKAYFYLDNGDGTDTVVEYDFPVNPNSSGAVAYNSVGNLHIDTRGPGPFAQSNNRKLIIRDIQIAYVLASGAGYTGSLFLDAGHYPRVSVNFLSVPAMSHYLGTNITGAKAGYSVAVASDTHVQVYLQPWVAAANYVDCDNKCAYISWQLQAFLQLHRILSTGAEPTFAASSFLSTVGKVLKAGGKIGKFVAPLAGNTPLGRAASMASNAQAVGKIMHPRGAPKTNQMGQPRYDGYMAGTFGPSGPLPVRAPNFSYPAYDEAGHWLIVPVVANGSQDPLVRAAIPTVAQLGAPSGQITGRSGSFAMLLSSLSYAGFPVKPGLYSGEVISITVERAANGIPDEVVFTLLPVKGEFEKIHGAASAGQRIRGLFESGWYSDDGFVELDPFSIFNPSKTAAAVTKVPPPPGYPGSAYRIRAWRL